MSRANRYLIIHGHFYQPPRENPWVWAIKPQKTAAPFANWNERINRECYAPNCLARLLDEKGRLAKLINNYEYLSFDFGPTLLSWLAERDPETYAQIIEADRRAAGHYEGHGPALAQVYNHLIMPLATERDRLTQIRWGAADFQARFGRQPEGMWLAETAVDLTTLKMLAAEGLRFTVLAQNQAAAVRELGDDDPAAWRNLEPGQVDPRQPYRVRWGAGEKQYLDVFFYDGPVSRAIAFENLLRDGATFLSRIEQAFGAPKADGSPRLVNLATDGESYGHHFPFGEMALAWLFEHLQSQKAQAEAIEVTNYGRHLALFPPRWEVKIIDNSSWSCAHGVERWRADCGCHTGGPAEWNQKWRAPLRRGLDSLRDELAQIFQREGERLFQDPWAARDEYVAVPLARYDREVQENFLRRVLRSGADAGRALALLEAQLMTLYMFTSCGWFFDEISGLEPLQNLSYALRAMELSGEEQSLGEGLRRELKSIAPNRLEYKNGLELWEREVLPQRLDGALLAAHWAAAQLFNQPQALELFEFPAFVGGELTRLELERSQILAALVTLKDKRLQTQALYLCLALAENDIEVSIFCEKLDEAAPLESLGLSPESLKLVLAEPQAAQEALARLRPQAVRFSLEDLWLACRHELLKTLADKVYDELKAKARELFKRHHRLLRLNRADEGSAAWLERFIFRAVAEEEFHRVLSLQETDPEDLKRLWAAWQNTPALAQEAKAPAGGGDEFLERLFELAARSPKPEKQLRRILYFIKFMRQEDFSFDIWLAQNRWYRLKSSGALELSREGRELMRELGLALNFSPALAGEESEA